MLEEQNFSRHESSSCQLLEQGCSVLLEILLRGRSTPRVHQAKCPLTQIFLRHRSMSIMKSVP